MIIVEHHFEWAEPLNKDGLLQVERVGPELRVTGLLPQYENPDQPSNLIGQYVRSARYRAVGKKRTNQESPEMVFANAETDDKLIAFVKRFGPVVAKCAFTNFDKPEEGLPEPRFPPRLSAVQDMEELRNEQLIYRSALTLLKQLNEPNFDYLASQRMITEIAGKITDWRAQWEREKISRHDEPFWELKSKALQRIKTMMALRPDIFFPPDFNTRIVLCELLNSFPSRLYPSPVEMHSSIKYGIRPLLYSLLRRQFVDPRDFALYANTQCKNFFTIERSGQKFCSADCSMHQRQRSYWAKRGKKLRAKRTKQQRKSDATQNVAPQKQPPLACNTPPDPEVSQ